MKLFALALALYFFTVSALPCPAPCVEPAAVNPSHSPQENGADDDCSTLCVSNCCGIVFDITSSLINLDAPFIQPVNFIFSEHHPLTNTASNIWQPPKKI